MEPVYRPLSFRLIALPAILVGLLACGPSETPGPSETGSVSPSARLETAAVLREDLAAPRHPSDGGGLAWLEGVESPSTASSPGSYTIVFETGPLGIAEGGMIYLLVSPFWGWSGVQTDTPDRPGYTTVTSEAEGVMLVPARLDQQLLGIAVEGRGLIAGEHVRITYGAGSVGAYADRYAESESRLWIAVDGDGDGVRKIIANSPSVRVVAGPPAQLVLTLPSVKAPGENARLTIALLDAAGNAGVEFAGDLFLEGPPGLTGLPKRVRLDSSDGGVIDLDVRAKTGGTFRVQARLANGISAVSNPMIVTEHGANIFWCDLHGHSGLSDGAGTPDDYLSYARDVAALDVVALTDHDHWGVSFLDAEPTMWQEIKQEIRRFNDPGRFVALLGYEWTSWVHGHRHVLYFSDEGEVFSSIDPAYDTPDELWRALEGRQAMTFAHHSAGGPIATNWDYPPNPHFEPCTEVASVHGSSEAADSPGLIYSPVSGNFVRDALDRGYRFCFVGSGDSHDGHPGLAHLASPSGGLTAVISDDLTRKGILEALRDRRTYATNGPRIILRFAVDGHPMGSTFGPPPDATADVVVIVEGTAPIERIDLIRSGKVVSSTPGDGSSSAGLATVLTDLGPGDYAYVRVVQTDGGAAWSSPVFFE